MYFDTKAAQWDKDPKKVERADIFAKEIKDFIKPGNKLNALEFGCGTGLLSFKLKDYFNNITLVDHSEGMIKVLKEKIEAQNIKHFTPLQIDLFEREIEFSQIDVIYTLMTLHHMTNLDKTLKEFSSILEPDGFLCIADLVKEDGSFHAHHKGFDGHNGFDKKELEEIMLKNGFEALYYKECYTIEKKLGDKIEKYPLFLMICKKQR